MSKYWYDLAPVEAIPATDEAIAELSAVGFGDYFYELTPEHLAALQHGQVLKLEIGSEYLAFVRRRPNV